MITEYQIDRAAEYLRNKQQSGKMLTPWKRTPNAVKKKWRVLAEGALQAAGGAGGPVHPQQSNPVEK